ncbi:hypothetical protein ACFEMC_19595 [Kineococcus sp. DHX-1]|uniref:hypothetical protein n=1 Tax=Kineococcus sp. DHX-1 TaxID=3349638 RepID=UPI0036D29E1A
MAAAFLHASGGGPARRWVAVRVPDLEALRPGDFVKVRGNGNPLHTGGRAVVVAVHREDSPPWRIVALDLRYSARGAAVRVELSGGGELARWETPWAPEQNVEETPHHELLAPGAAHVDGRGSRRRVVVVAGLVALVVVGVLTTWGQQRTPPNPVVVQRALQEGVRGTGTASGAPSQTATATATRVAASATVVAWSAGPVPVVAGLDGDTAPQQLAGVVPAEGCRDAYVRDLFSYLPIGQRVDVAGAGWYRTDDGLDVNEELVRTGVAVPDPASAGTTSTDTEHLRTVQRLAADAPRC